MEPGAVEPQIEQLFDAVAAAFKREKAAGLRRTAGDATRAGLQQWARLSPGLSAT